VIEKNHHGLHRMFGYICLVWLLGACQAPATNPDGWHGAFLTSRANHVGQIEDFDDDQRHAIPDSGSVTLIVYNHGTSFDGINQRCRPTAAIPPTFLKLARYSKTTVVYYLCSRETGLGARSGAKGQIWYNRGIEIAHLLDRLSAYGVPRENIFLAGHSGGASAVLSAAADHPEKFNAFIVSAPGYGYAHSGYTRQHPLLSKRYHQWKDHITSGEKMDGIVFGYLGDQISPIADMDFLADIPGVEFIEVQPEFCQPIEPHMFVGTDCFDRKYRKHIEAFIQNREGQNATKSAAMN